MKARNQIPAPTRAKVFRFPTRYTLRLKPKQMARLYGMAEETRRAVATIMRDQLDHVLDRMEKATK